MASETFDLLSSPRRAAVLGSPIAHSLSPVLHNAAYARLGLPWTYTAYDVQEPDLAAFVAGLGPEWAGLSLTMPLKRAVLPLLSTVSHLAETVQAANTVVCGPHGMHGDNTDVPGMHAALEEADASELVASAESMPVLLGAGATAGSALAALHSCGAGQARVVARSASRAGEVTDVAHRLGMTVEVVPWSSAVVCVAQADVVVSTTPAGATDDMAGSVRVRRPEAVLFDVVYAPWPTALSAAWSSAGGRVISGFELLIHQAALQVELMIDRRCRSTVLPAMRAALADVHESYSRALL